MPIRNVAASHTTLSLRNALRTLLCVTVLTIIDHLEKTIAKLCEKDLDKDAGKDWSTDVEGIHGKVCVAIEEMVNMGHVEHLDTESVLRLSKLKKPVQS